jgi:hypothetical protein
MHEGLLYTGMMAAVVGSAAVITAVSPNLLRQEHVPSTPSSIHFPTSVPVPTVPTSSGVAPPPTAPLEVAPIPATQVPPSVKTSPARPAPKPSPAPIPPPPVTGQGEPPSPGEPCPIGLTLNPVLGVCVVI